MRRWLLLILLLIPASAGAQLEAGKLGVAIPYPVASIETLGNQDPVNQLIVSNLASGLLRKTADGWGLEAASSYSGTGSGKVHTFEIRSDLAFSSGKIVTAESVKASFEYFMRRAQDILQRRMSSRARLGTTVIGTQGGTAPLQSVIKGLSNIQEIVLIERPSYYFSGHRYNAIRFVLSEADANFATTVATIPIIDAEISEAFKEKFADGTLFAALGPYQIRSNRPDEGALLERTPFYFRPGFPRSPLLEFKAFEEAPAALSALRVGAVDIIAIPTPKLLEDAAADPTLQIISSPLMRVSESWQLPSEFWSQSGDENDKLVLNKVIIRKTLKIDERFLQTFDLSGVFLP